MGFERFIQFVQNGEPVSASVTNRPTEQLDQNVRHLWATMEAIGFGSTLCARMQPINGNLQVGQPVYFDTVTGKFEPAFAVVDSDPVSGFMVFPDRAQVWGVVSYKHALESADILLQGFLKVDIRAAVDITVPADEPVPAGLWYLSSSDVGKLTQQAPPVTVPVLKTDATGGVYVNPEFRDFLENHRHYVFQLAMQPAGTTIPPIPGDPHVITDADSDLPGWLPADHAVFAGNAPVGAKFGYNIAAEPVLSGVFPPVPLQSAMVVMQRPSVYTEIDKPRIYGQELTPDLVIVDRNGIWWMRDCYDEVPWPTLLDTGYSESSSVYELDACDGTDSEYSLRLYFTRVGFATDNTAVRSLSSDDPRIDVFCVGTTTQASTGDLALSLNIPFTTREENIFSGLAFKGFDAIEGVFDAGPVLEGVYASTPNVVLQGEYFTTDELGRTLHYGRVGVGVLDQANQELSSQLVRLDGVTEEHYPVLYLGMPNDTPTSFVVKFEVPSTAPASSSFRYIVRLLGRAAGTLPQLTIDYYKSARPVDGLTTPIAVTQSYASLAITTVAAVTANTAVEATSEVLTVDPGDIVYIRVKRNPSDVGDAYAGEVGVMQQVGSLYTT
jgi:hypothetical protein